jgi:hypothetical protein
MQFPSFFAQAYFVAIPQNQSSIDYSKPTRLLISGRGANLGGQPRLAALGRYQVYRQNFSTDQYVLLSVIEEKYDSEPAISKAGWKIIKSNNVNFETKVILSEMLKFSKIRSIDFFGHNSPLLGTQTDGLGFRFDFRVPEVKDLASHFYEDAFVIVHGCNSGWLIATSMAKTWNIAVAGSFTETRFEHLHSDGHFYVYDNKHAPNPNWARKNPDLDGASCKSSGGGCIRLRPKTRPYIGKWGHYYGPLLPHYKFFCPLQTRECEKRMALSLYGFLGERSLRPNASLGEFQDLAKEYLCPLDKDRKIKNDCLKQLELVDLGQQSHLKVNYVESGKQLKCDFKDCDAKMICDDHSCTVKFGPWAEATTLTDEYLHLVNGFRWLTNEVQ